MSFALCVIGCGQYSSRNTEAVPSDRYQIAISNDGKVYRLDKKSGEMVFVNDGAFKRITELQPINLVVDSIYKTNEGNIIQYKGGTTFVPSTRQLTLDLDAIDAELVRRQNKKEEAVPKRLPGETIPAYLERTKQK